MFVKRKITSDEKTVTRLNNKNLILAIWLRAVPRILSNARFWFF